MSLETTNILGRTCVCYDPIVKAQKRAIRVSKEALGTQWVSVKVGGRNQIPQLLSTLSAI